LGIKVNPNRIQIVNVNGGPGAPSDASGSIETTLDVEQSGGIAPGANIIVYQGSNFFVDLVDVFAAAIDANKADSLGISWGVWEWLANLENYPVPDPITGRTVAATQAIHELLLRASIQGQSVYASSGDGGAYEANYDFGCYGPYSPSVAGSCSLALTVLYPASDSYITATGGTTLPGLQEYCENAACTPPYYDINIPHERVWGWDYLDGLCKFEGYTPISCGIFGVGSGGGVSVSFFEPLYQLGIFGTELSQPNQAFYLQPYGLLDALPAFYPGRNVPDVSFNADPDTGYLLYYTSSATNTLAIIPEVGGTSIVDQQLNGVTALLGQALNRRVGFLNPTLYGLIQNGRGYFGPNAPLNAIAYGDNWFYYGSNGYNPAAGAGTMNVANFAEALRGWFGGGPF
jgi:subtilase family serine protease